MSQGSAESGSPRIAPLAFVGIAVLVVSGVALGVTSSSSSNAKSPGRTTPVTFVPPQRTTTTTTMSTIPTAPSITTPTSVATRSFLVDGVSFPDALHGWALGTLNCPEVYCDSVVLSTSDGGHTWADLQPKGLGAAFHATQLEFLNARNGLMLAKSTGTVISNPATIAAPTFLWFTADAGQSWTRMTVADGGLDDPIFDASSTLGVLAVCNRTGQSLYATSAPTSDAPWQPASITLPPTGVGPVCQHAVRVKGSNAWVLNVGRSILPGARFDRGHWATWKVPCPTTIHTHAAMSASAPNDVDVVCQSTPATSAPVATLFVSTNAGAEFTPTPSRPTSAPGLDDTVFTIGTSFATLMSSTLVLATGGPGGRLIISRNGGKTWRAGERSPKPIGRFSGGWKSVQIFFPVLAVAIAADGTALVSRDGARNWTDFTFPPLRGTASGEPLP